jgi:hypothetical protein
MRLLHVETTNFHEFYGSHVPAYAILSHRWEDEEVTYQEMINCMLEAKGKRKFWGSNKKERPATRSKKGFDKIEECCRQATRDGLQYVWIDTFCIDKSSSAELTEAINSRYYISVMRHLLSLKSANRTQRGRGGSLQLNDTPCSLAQSANILQYVNFRLLQSAAQSAVMAKTFTNCLFMFQCTNGTKDRRCAMPTYRMFRLVCPTKPNGIGLRRILLPDRKLHKASGGPEAGRCRS